MFTIGNRGGNNNRKPNMSAAGNNFLGKGYVVGGTMNMNSAQRPFPGNVTNKCYLQGQQNDHPQQQRNFHNMASRASYQPPAYIANGNVNNNSGNGLINGFKNFFNGLINPSLRLDFHSDHHRYYNPKYRNNYKYGADQQFNGRQQNHQPPFPHHNTFSAEKSFPDTHLQTVFIDLNASKISCSQPQKQECGMDSAGVVAIFTSEDFPALPTPRRPPTPSAAPTAAPTTKQGPPVLTAAVTATASVTIPTKSAVLPSWEPEPKQKCAYFEFIEFSNPVRRRCGGPMGLRPASRASQVSECDSEDSFVIFSHDADSTVIATSPASSTSSGRFYRPQRERQLSECSDDSFVICFSEDAADGVLQICNDSDDEDSETDEEEEGDEDDTDDEADEGGTKEESRDVPDGKSVNLLMAGSQAESEIFAVESHRENPIENKTDQSEDTTDNVIAFLPNQLDSGFDERIREKKKVTPKTVRFNLKPQVRVMHTWEFAHRKCRKGPWEQFARDCFRFKQRIENLQEVLDPILDGKHREKIYQERFCQKEIKS